MSLEPDPVLAAIAADTKEKRKRIRAIPSTCEECGKSCPSKTALDSHIRADHPIEPPFNDAVREKFLRLLCAGGLPIKSIRKLEISPYTLRRAMQIDPTFAEAVALAEEEGAEEIEEVLRGKAVAGEPWAVTKWLEKRSKPRWNADQNVNVNVSGNIQHNARFLPHENDILNLRETARERARLKGTQLSIANPEIIDAEIVENSD